MGRIAGYEDKSVQYDIAHSLAPGMPIHHDDDALAAAKGKRPVVVGVDGSETSRHALRFAIDFAALHHAPLQVMFCWQLKDLGEVPGYENAIASIGAGQDHAQDIVRRMIEQADIPDGLQVTGKAFHIAAAKGLPTASQPSGRRIPRSERLGRPLPRFRVEADPELRGVHGHHRALSAIARWPGCATPDIDESPVTPLRVVSQAIIVPSSFRHSVAVTLPVLRAIRGSAFQAAGI